MTQPPTTDQDRLNDLWHPRSATTEYQPVAGYGMPETMPRGIGLPPSPVQHRVRPVFSELLLVLVLSMVVAAAMGWQILRHVHSVIPGTGTDPLTELWALGWSGHALNPGSGIPFTGIFDGNAFYPAQYSLALADSFLGYGPLTWFFHGAGGLVQIHNLLFVFAPALSSFGAYALARQLGAHPLGAAVAGAGFAYAPWHTGQFAHLSLLSTGPLVIALAMLARGHGLTLSGQRQPSRPLWVLLGWIVAAWQFTIGFTNSLPFAVLLFVVGILVALITPVRWYLNRRAAELAEFSRAPQTRPRDDPRPRLRWLLPADLIGGALFAATGAFMAYPYIREQRIDPTAVGSSRSLAQITLNSPRPVDLITAPSAHGTWSWLSAGATLGSSSSDLRMLPGAILIFFAVLGLLFSTWRWWWRWVLAASAALIAGLALGTRFPGALFPGASSPFELIWKHTPAWAITAHPAQLMVFCTLPLAILAAGAVSRLCGHGSFGYRGRALGLRSAALAIVPVLIVLEGWASIPHQPVPATPAALTAADEPLVVLPSNPATDGEVMFWSTTSDYPALANGQGPIASTSVARMRKEMRNFPDATSVAYLRSNGFRSVVLLRSQLPGTVWQSADRKPSPKLGLTRTEKGNCVIFTVGPAK